MKNQQRLFALLSAGGGTAVLLFTLLFSLTRPLQAMSCNVSGGGSIQSAIDDVNCDTIIVAAGTFMENLNIGRSLTIQGAGASGTIIDGGGNGRVVTINGSVTVYLDNLRLTNGDATGESIRFREGGAIAVLVTTQEAQLMVNGDRFLNNIANASLDDFDTNEHTGGGAISLMAMNTAGRITGTITSAYMSGNAAKAGNTNTGEGRGGAIHARGATLIVRQSTIMDNISDARGVEGFGGGVYIREPDTGDYLEVVGSALAGNTAANS
ncbi:MAG: hypothetical protein HF973_16050, partial [Chloroflexi bacterium]|nr:hypothetical protein [Chloroflexota bacterium]